jgi:hypothetical protein
MLSSAVRRPARVDRTPRRTRATAPAHSKPSCKGAVFLDFDSFIEHCSHESKRGPNSRSTLHIPLGRGEPEFPAALAVLAGMIDPGTGHCPIPVGSLRSEITTDPRSASRHGAAIGSVAIARSGVFARTKSLSHRISVGATLSRKLPGSFPEEEAKHAIQQADLATTSRSPSRTTSRTLSARSASVQKNPI